MYVKKCPYCSGSSYSASDHGKWACPYCGIDLTFARAKPAGVARDQVCGQKRLVDLIADFKNSNKSLETKIKDNILYLKSK